MINFFRIILIIIYVFDVYTLNGGERAQMDQFKYFIGILYDGELRCSGAIIHESYVITIGQCLKHFDNRKLSVITIHETERQYAKVKNIIFFSDFKYIYFYEDWNYPAFSNDFAIIKLGTPFIMGPNTAPIRITPGNCEWLFARQCSVAGWLHSPLTNSSGVHWVRTFTINSKICQSKMKINLRENEKCVEYDHWRSPINNWDVGAALDCKNFLVGILVREKMHSPSIFLDICNYREFIYRTISDNENFVKERSEFSASIWTTIQYICGGSILDNYHILTAAHCVVHHFACNLFVVAGITEIESIDTMEWLSVLYIIPHPDYRLIYVDDEETQVLRSENDIAILRLLQPLQFGLNIAPIPLTDRQTEYPQICKMSRWLFSHPNYLYLPFKYETVSTRTMSPEICSEIGVSLGPNVFCSDYLYSIVVSLDGNSGSPLFCNGKVVGILLGGPLMKSQEVVTAPLLFLNLYPYFDFIGNYTGGAFLFYDKNIE